MGTTSHQLLLRTYHVLEAGIRAVGKGPFSTRRGLSERSTVKCDRKSQLTGMREREQR